VRNQCHGSRAYRSTGVPPLSYNTPIPPYPHTPPAWSRALTSELNMCSKWRTPLKRLSKSSNLSSGVRVCVQPTAHTQELIFSLSSKAVCVFVWMGQLSFAGPSPTAVGRHTAQRIKCSYHASTLFTYTTHSACSSSVLQPLLHAICYIYVYVKVVSTAAAHKLI
jgi:hypothetical protein